jgi:putative NIF3 family GTP cyclohydrolase 1 type 2
MKNGEARVPFTDHSDRRKFMLTLTQAFGAVALLSRPTFAESTRPPAGWTVGQIIDRFTKQVPGAPLANTVDTLKAGSRDMEVTSIVTTMFATLAVIEKAINLKANFIIAHEPTFYNHLDDTAWLKGDDVYEHKAELLKKHDIAVWRNHDHIHRLRMDGVTAGVVSRLGWEKLTATGKQNVIEIPTRPLRSVIDHVKEKLQIERVRYVGDLSQPCTSVLLLPGASGGRNQITAIGSEKPDVVLCGEVSEWETAEYVRDANAMGKKMALVVLGHAVSEEPGSEFLASWLRENINGVEVTHIPAGNPLKFA